MTKGYVPYVTLGDETIVTHTCHENESEIKVYFEQPDDEYFFKYLEINLSSLKILQKHGFTNTEIAKLKDFALDNYELMVKYSKVGGILSA